MFILSHHAYRVIRRIGRVKVFCIVMGKFHFLLAEVMHLLPDGNILSFLCPGIGSKYDECGN